MAKKTIEVGENVRWQIKAGTPVLVSEVTKLRGESVYVKHDGETVKLHGGTDIARPFPRAYGPEKAKKAEKPVGKKHESDSDSDKHGDSD